MVKQKNKVVAKPSDDDDLEEVTGLRRTQVPGEFISDDKRKEEIAANRKKLKDNAKRGKIKRALDLGAHALLGGEYGIEIYADQESYRKKMRREARGRLRELKTKEDLRG